MSALTKDQNQTERFVTLTDLMSVRDVTRTVVATTLVVTMSVTSHKSYLARSKQAISHKVTVSTLQNAAAIARAAGHRKPRNNVAMPLPLQVYLYEIYDIFASSFFERIGLPLARFCRVGSGPSKKTNGVIPNIRHTLIGLIRVALPIKNY